MLNSLKNLKFLVIGDSILDIWITGNSKKLAQESSAPVIEVDYPKYSLGGAGNVADIIANENGKTTFVTVLGKDNSGDKIKKILKKGKISKFVYLQDETKSTSTKIRINEKYRTIMRLDKETSTLLGVDLQDQLLNIILDKLKGHDAIIISDYAKGILSEYIVKAIIKISRKLGKKVFADIKPNAYKKYKHSYFVKLNIYEFKEITKCNIEDMSDVLAKIILLRKELEVEHLLITLGSQGMIYSNSVDTNHIPGFHTQNVKNIIGAGDFVLALVSMCNTSGISMRKSIEIANYGASLKIQNDYQTPISLHFILYSFLLNKYKLKYLNIQKFLKMMPLLKDKKIVFTNGCFDVLHPGHIKLLSASKKLGDILVVGINTDDSIKRLKGESRPFYPLKDRIMQLKALSFVDFIIPFSEDTPLNLIQEIKPQILTKGSDYSMDRIIGSEFVNSYGGKVVIIDKYSGYSSTCLIEKKKYE